MWKSCRVLSFASPVRELTQPGVSSQRHRSCHLLRAPRRRARHTASPCREPPATGRPRLLRAALGSERPALTAASVGGSAGRGRRAARGRRGERRAEAVREHVGGSGGGERGRGVLPCAARFRETASEDAPQKEVRAAAAGQRRAGFLCAPLPARAGRAAGPRSRRCRAGRLRAARPYALPPPFPAPLLPRMGSAAGGAVSACAGVVGSCRFRAAGR